MKGLFVEAEDLAVRCLQSLPERMNPYQSLGELEIQLLGLEAPVEGYERELDLATGIARAAWVRVGARCTEEVLASAPDQVIAVRIESDGPLRFFATLALRPLSGTSGAEGPDTVFHAGQAGPDGPRWHAAVRAVAEGGEFSTAGDNLTVDGARAVTLLVAAGTDFRGGDPRQRVREQLDAAARRAWAAIRADAAADHGRLFSHVTLEIEGSADRDSVPTDECLAAVKAGGRDPGLPALYFHYGRYLLIASSRPGTLPANLQGIWNDSMTPPWESKCTININTEMNYWPAEVANLAECAGPLFDLVDRIGERGRETARRLNGCRGFVAHHNVDIGADTAPVDPGTRHAYRPMGAAWLATHLWEHYLFGCDRAFLRERALPVLRGCVEFFADFLVEDDQARLLSGPSVSPENAFRLSDGGEAGLCMAPIIDNQIIRAVLSAFVQGCADLGLDDPLAARAAAMIPHLPPTRLGRHGQVMEWLEDYDEADPGHRCHRRAAGRIPVRITERGEPPYAGSVPRQTAHRHDTDH